MRLVLNVPFSPVRYGTYGINISELTVQLLRAGADASIPFSPIVASGPNGANPHAFPTARTLQAGDFVTLDWGCTVKIMWRT